MVFIKQDAIDTAVARIAGTGGKAVQINTGVKQSKKDVGHALQKGDVGDTHAAVKNDVPTAGDGAAQRNIGQPGTIQKCLRPNARNRVGDHIASGLAHGTLDERGLIFVKQDTIQAAQHRIIG